MKRVTDFMFNLEDLEDRGFRLSHRQTRLNFKILHVEY